MEEQIETGDTLTTDSAILNGLSEIVTKGAGTLNKLNNGDTLVSSEELNADGKDNGRNPDEQTNGAIDEIEAENDDEEEQESVEAAVESSEGAAGEDCIEKPAELDDNEKPAETLEENEQVAETLENNDIPDSQTPAEITEDAEKPAEEDEKPAEKSGDDTTPAESPEKSEESVKLDDSHTDDDDVVEIRDPNADVVHEISDDAVDERALEADQIKGLILKELLHNPLLLDSDTKIACPDPRNSSNETMDEAMGDDDFDPSLLCPEMSMDIDESSVITNDYKLPDDEDGRLSPVAVFSTAVDEMTGAEINFDLTPAEQELRIKLYENPEIPIQESKMHCTACNLHLGSSLEGQKNRFVHPLLKVLVCRNCYNFYMSGDFEKDEDGSELYCRWCGQGGQVLCCFTCEFVFCKKCIRTNFGKEKLIAVRDSDEWKCFRCDPSQLAMLRVKCAEFFEYVRRETMRAATLDDTDFMQIDHTTCCKSLKRSLHSNGKDERKPKRPRMEKDLDPDFVPTMDDLPSRPSTSGVKKPIKILPTPTTTLPAALLPKPAPVLQAGQHIMLNPFSTNQMGNQMVSLRIGNTQFRQKIGPFTANARPMLKAAINSVAPTMIRVGGKNLMLNRAGIPMALQSRQVSPGQVRQVVTTQNRTLTTNRTIATFQTRPVLPGQLRPQTRVMSPSQLGIRPTTVSRQMGIRQAGPHTSGASKPLVIRAQHSQINQGPADPNNKQNEWFEKTVRAAARVNSNMSFTLTNLNNSQAAATSIEELATVHNKLQECLSNSINSLIQIRKNLRQEFITGIKSVRFPPPKLVPMRPLPSTSARKDDDDVIIVNPGKQLPKVVRQVTDGGSTNFVRKSNSVPATAPDGTFKYLKVKSFSDLQTVSSDCITIPDDVPSTSGGSAKITLVEDPVVAEVPVVETPIAVPEPTVVVPEPEVVVPDPPIVAEEPVPEVPVAEEPVPEEVVPVKEIEPVLVPLKKSKVKALVDYKKFTFDTLELPSPEIRRMMSAEVNITRIGKELFNEKLQQFRKHHK